MRHQHFTVKEHGFAGDLAEPDGGSEYGVLLIMGGEGGLFPGIKFAERFADYGITALAVSLFGAEGLPDSPNQIPLEMFLPPVRVLRAEKGIEHVSVYGQSMGSIFAVLIARYIGGMDNLILVSPAHVPFEGTLADKKTMTGKSVAVWEGEDIPFVRADFSAVKAMKYGRHPAADYSVTGMWTAYYQAYLDKEREAAARLAVEKTGARVLLIAGAQYEIWPAAYSVQVLERRLKESGFPREVKTVVYPHGSHLNGMMPNRKREGKLYLLLSLIGVMYRTFGKYRKENLAYCDRSEKEIVRWILGSSSPEEES